MIRGQISIGSLRKDILAASQDCRVVVVEAKSLIELHGASAADVALTLESRGFSQDSSSGDGSGSDDPIIFQAAAC